MQTRMQKMPYKHIAAQLKKTELACRLHYHQLTHGANRRKRAVSCSSVSSDHSYMRHGVPTPPREFHDSQSRSISPVGLRSTPSFLQLPSIAQQADGTPPFSTILPKPQHLMPYPSEAHRLPTPERHEPPPAPFARVCAPASLTSRMDSYHTLPPPSVSAHAPVHVDLSRLHSVYDAHRTAFWAAIAHEYGTCASPTTLERAWQTGSCCPQGRNGGNAVIGMDKRTRISSILV